MEAQTAHSTAAIGLRGHVALLQVLQDDAVLNGFYTLLTQQQVPQLRPFLRQRFAAQLVPLLHILANGVGCRPVVVYFGAITVYEHEAFYVEEQHPDVATAPAPELLADGPRVLLDLTMVSGTGREMGGCGMVGCADVWGHCTCQVQAAVKHWSN